MTPNSLLYEFRRLFWFFTADSWTFEWLWRRGERGGGGASFYTCVTVLALSTSSPQKRTLIFNVCPTKRQHSRFKFRTLKAFYRARGENDSRIKMLTTNIETINSSTDQQILWTLSLRTEKCLKKRLYNNKVRHLLKCTLTKFAVVFSRNYFD